MTNLIINNIFRFILLILLQVLVLNNIQFSGVVNPYLYVLFILLLPFETPGWLLLISSFFLGLLIDIFPQGISASNYFIGLHASASVLMAYLRPLVLRYFSPNDGYEIGTKPTMGFYGFSWVFKYSFFLILPHHLLLFFLEELTFSHFFVTISRVIFSLIFTFILVIISQYLFFNKS